MANGDDEDVRRRQASYFPAAQILAGSTNTPSVTALNRPRAEWGSPSALTTSGQPSVRTPAGTGVVQGPPLSPEEQEFWSQHPMGAVKDPISGNLIGLGKTPQSAQAITERTYSQPSVFTSEQQSQSSPSVDTESLLNQVIQRKSELQQQRQGLTNERSQLINQLSTTPAGRRGAVQQKVIQAKLHSLDLAERHLDSSDKFEDANTQMRINSSFRNASAAHKFATEDLIHRTAEQASEVFLRGTEIMGKYKPGTQEFHDEMTKLKEQYPLGFASEAVKGHFGPIAKFHEQETDRVQKLATNDLAKAGLTPAEFAAHENPRRGKLDENTGEFTNQYTGAEKGKIMAFDIGGKTFHAPVDVYNRLDKVLGRPKSDIKQATSAVQPETEPVGMVSTVRGQPLRRITEPAGAAGQPIPTNAAPAVSQGLQIKDENEYHQLPSGSLYIDPSGVKRRKP